MTRFGIGIGAAALAILTVIGGEAVAQSAYPPVKFTRSVGSDEKLWPLCPREGGECGYVDKAGKWVVEPRFEEDSVFVEDPFKDGGARVKLSGKWGFIDRTGKWVLEPRFEHIGSLSEGLFRVWLDDKWGYVDKIGEWVIEPRFEGASDFSAGLALAALGGKYGFIDKTGKWAVEPRFKYAGDFSEGLAYAALDGSNYGVIDKTGKWVIKPQFKFVGPFSDGLAKATSGSKNGYVDKTGSWVLQPRFDYADDKFFEGLARISRIIDDYGHTRSGFIDKTGAWAVEPKFEEAQRFSDGLAAVKLGGKWGFIDKTGAWAIKPRFDEAGGYDNFRFQKGVAAVKLGGKWGYVNASGKWMVEPKYDSVWLDGDLILVRLGNRRGYVDLGGKPLTFSPDDLATGAMEARLRRQQEEIDRLKVEAAQKQAQTSSTSSDYQPGQGAYLCSKAGPCAVSIVAKGGDRLKVEFTSYCRTTLITMASPGEQDWFDRKYFGHTSDDCPR